MDNNGKSMRAVCVGVLVLTLSAMGSTGNDAPPALVDGWNVHLAEASDDVGIAFRTAGEIHDPTGVDKDWPAFPEIMGAGACWADFNGDGHEDLYIANQRYNDVNPFAAGFNEQIDPTNRLYMNDGDGAFTDRTAAAGVESRMFDYGCSAVDPDADGDPDLFVTGYGHVRLYQNRGDATFADVTQAAGLDVTTACLPSDCWTTCSAWADYDRDGWLDLFVCTYVESDMADQRRGPENHVAQLNFLFRNNGDGTFTGTAAQAGVEGIAADAQGSKSLGAVWFDGDRDGWPDLYVANDMTPNEMYWNNGDGTFTRDDEAGLYDARAGMGVAVADFTGDGDQDLYITHYADQHNGFYENRGEGTFLDRSGEGALAADLDYVGWGTHFVDLDRDAILDLVAANGHTVWFNEGSYNQDTLVFQGISQPGGGRTWQDRSSESGPGAQEKRVTRGAAFADYDLDGNMDIVLLNNANQTLQFLRGTGNMNAWLYVQPTQPGPNPQAIGARVVVEAAGTEQTREIQAGSSYLSQNSLLADFGLAQATDVDRITVHWPDGASTVIEDLPVDRIVRIDRATGDYTTDTLSPVTGHALDGALGDESWFRSTVDLTLAAQDRAIGPPSGVAGSEYRIEGGPWTPYPAAGVPFEAEGEHTVTYRSLDESGNTEPARSASFGVDLTPPAVSHRIEGTPGSNGWWHQADLVLEPQDPLSGVQETLYRIDGGEWTPYLAPVALEDGEQVIEYTARDKAGNQAAVEQTSVRVDETPPMVNLMRPESGVVYTVDGGTLPVGVGPAIVLTLPEQTGVGHSTFEVRVTATDATSGLERLDLFLNGQREATRFHEGPDYTWVWETGASPAGFYLLEAVATDAAGNPATVHVQVVLVPATLAGIIATVTNGPGLYPTLPPE